MAVTRTVFIGSFPPKGGGGGVGACTEVHGDAVPLLALSWDTDSQREHSLWNKCTVFKVHMYVYTI